jgi:hypothetical protein
MELGDVSCHHGWTLHMAPGQRRNTQARVALAVSYFADGAQLLDWKAGQSLREDLRHSEDLESYESWTQAIRSGGYARHKDIPVVFRRQSSQR